MLFTIIGKRKYILGIFKCIACNVDLFPSECKFESGSGWPSFYDTKKIVSIQGGPKKVYDVI